MLPGLIPDTVFLLEQLDLTDPLGASPARVQNTSTPGHTPRASKLMSPLRFCRTSRKQRTSVFGAARQSHNHPNQATESLAAFTPDPSLQHPTAPPCRQRRRSHTAHLGRGSHLNRPCRKSVSPTPSTNGRKRRSVRHRSVRICARGEDSLQRWVGLWETNGLVSTYRIWHNLARIPKKTKNYSRALEHTGWWLL